jgi:hypothetical protein
MSVVDPIFDSLWDATLSELAAEPGIWEVYWDTPNFFARASPGDRAAEAEKVLRRLHTEGWVEFVRRPWNAPMYSAGHVLGDEEVEGLITSDAWRSDPPLPNGQLPDELNVWLVATEKWRLWSETNQL